MLDYSTLVFAAIGSALGSLGAAVWYILIFRLKIWEAFKLRNLKRRTWKLRVQTNNFLDVANKRLETEYRRREELVRSLETEDEPYRKELLEYHLNIANLEIEKLEIIQRYPAKVKEEIDLYDDKIFEIESDIEGKRKPVLDKTSAQIFVNSLILALTSALVISASIEFVSQYTTFFDYMSSRHLDIVNSAHASAADQSQKISRDAASLLVSIVISGALFLLASAFLVCLFVVLFVSHTEENMGRVGFAKDVVKTFGGFFAGIITTFLKTGM